MLGITPGAVDARGDHLAAQRRCSSNIGAGAEHGAGGARARRREGEGPRSTSRAAIPTSRPIRRSTCRCSTRRSSSCTTRSAGRSCSAPAPQPQEPSALELSQRREDIGSNNWVVSGKLTQSGYPLMMNDPHRNQGAPSLRYWVHLVAPGWNVIGGGEPVLPGVSIGHNEYGAWGLTIFGSDSEDLYVYETNPANPNQYKYRGAWEDMRVVKDTIQVKGAAPVSVDLKFTRHGPVLSEDRGAPQGVRAARGVDGAGRGAVPREPAHGSGEVVGGVRRGVHLQPHPVGEHGVGRPQGQHRLPGGGDHAAAAELVGAGAGAGRRPLRVERLPADQRAAARGEPGEGILSRRRTTICFRRTISTRKRCTTPAPIRTAPRASARCSDRGGCTRSPT